MKWNNIKITIYKELRGIVRDKKSLQKLILYPLLIPAVILLFGFLFDTVNESKYLLGTNYPLTEEEKIILKEFDNIKMVEYKNQKELEEAYHNQEISGYILKDGNSYTIYGDESQNSGEIVTSVSISYLDSYNKVLETKALVKEGIDPNTIFNRITYTTKSLSKEESNTFTTIILSLIITYIIMIVVMVSVVVVTDATSGEKERGTLETILTFPIKSGELVLGKYIATAILSFSVGTVSYLLSIPMFTIGKELFKSFEDIVFITKFSSILLVIFVIFLAALLSSGVCMALAGKTKTYKEAQSSLQFVSFFPMLPYFLRIMEVDNSLFNLIPIANCGTLLNDIVMNTINMQSLLIIILSTIVYIVIIIAYISKQYKKEETLFS